MDPGEACPGPNGDITQYQISFQAGSFETVNTARCTAGRCSFAFRPPSNPPSSYDNVSVAAENVVGVGAAQKCTTQTISELHLSTLFLFILFCCYMYYQLICTYMYYSWSKYTWKYYKYHG